MGIFLLLALAASVVASPEQYQNTTGCPLWHHRPSRNSTHCVCGSDWNQQIVCRNGQVYLKHDFLLGTMDSSPAGEPYPVTVIAESWFVSVDFNVSSKVRSYYPLPNTTNETEINDMLCRPNNRKGFLCEECLPNYGPNAYHSMCSKCDWSMQRALSLYLFTKIIPAVVWFLFIMTFRINLARGPLIGYLIFCQLYVFLVSSENNFYVLPWPLKSFEYVSFCLSALWSLDFFHITHIIKPFCISRRLRTRDIMLLNFISTLTPLLLAVTSYLIIELYAQYSERFCRCLKPLCRCLALFRNWTGSDSLIHAYASLYILAFPLLNYNTYKVLKVTNLYGQMNIVRFNVLIMHPRLHLYSPEMIPYFVVVMVLLLFLVVLPSLLLLLYPMKIFRGRFHKCCSQRFQIGLNTFVDTFQGPFKNGCNGTRDFRIIPGIVSCLVLAYTMFCCLQHVFSHSSSYSSFALSAFLGVASTLCAYLRPCKSRIANLSLAFHCMWMAGFSLILALWNTAPSVGSTVLMTLLALCSSLPHILMALWITYTLETKFFHVHHKLAACFKSALGKRLFGNRTDTEFLPDRLINSHQYREML